MDILEQKLKENNIFYIYPILKQSGILSWNYLIKLNLNDIENLTLLSTLEKNKLLQMILENEKIIVCVRKRPIKDNNDDAIDVKNNSIIVNEPKLKVDLQSYTEKHQFWFDRVFEKDASNDFIYENCINVITKHVINRGCGSIIAYGQTGTGKTYTMMEETSGIIYKSLYEIMKVKTNGNILFCEIYLGNIYDLIKNREKIVLREVSGIVHLTNSTSVEFNSYDEAVRIIKKGLNLRRTGVTGANKKSSRSHAILIVNFDKSIINAITSSNSLIFVDLAGSERGIDRKIVSNETKAEGAEINKSLLALKECIRGIEQDKKHLPFRQSKLTQILKNSFIGESKTCILATISPSYDNIEHTLNTLRYASRIKDFKKQDSPFNSPLKINEDCENDHSHSSYISNGSLFLSPKFNISSVLDDKTEVLLKNNIYKILDDIKLLCENKNHDELEIILSKVEDLFYYVDR